MGSGLRVLQENHVINGCCWLNHSQQNCRKFIEIVRENLSIKVWFSGHFHIGHDYQDSIIFPGNQDDIGNKSKNSRGSCIFVQTACMSAHSSRDNRQQSRLIKGNQYGFSINTVDHKDGKERIDVSITYSRSKDLIAKTSEIVHNVNAPVSTEEAPVSTLSTGTSDLIIYAHDNDDFDHDKFFAAYTPEEEDGCYIEDCDDEAIKHLHQNDMNENRHISLSQSKKNINTKENSVCWWHMSDGRVLGVHNGMVLEYDHLTLAPLGLVVGREQLKGRYLAIVDSGIEIDQIKLKLQNSEKLSSGQSNLNHREQAIILYDDDFNVTVVQPNEDGSYWRKIVRNKVNNFLFCIFSSVFFHIHFPFS